jgi:hypothetical protein
MLSEDTYPTKFHSVSPEADQSPSPRNPENVAKVSQLWEHFSEP